jgi:hypothetical protein
VMDIAPLEQLSEQVLKAASHLFDVKPVTLLKPAKREMDPLPGFKAPNPPAGIAVHFLTTAATAGKAELTCLDASGKRVGLYLSKDKAGLDSCVFDVTTPGEYTITLKANGESQSKKVTVKMEADTEPKKKVDE